MENQMVETVGKFFGLLMHSRNIFHIKHLQTKSFAEHIALDELYKSLPDHIDSIIESYQGRTGKIIEKYYFPNDTYPNKTPLEYAIIIRDFVDANRNTLGKYSEIQNLVDELIGQLNSTIYKLTNLK